MKHTTIASAIAVLLLVTTAEAQTCPMLETAGGSGNDAANAIAADQFGGIVTVGMHTGAMVFDQTHSISAPPGSAGAWIARYGASSGSVIWARTFAPSGEASSFAVCTYGSAAYVAVAFSANAPFSFDAVNFSATNSSYDVALLKFDLVSGSLVWGQQIGQSGEEFGMGIAADAGGVYLTGAFSGTLAISGPAMTSAGSLDVFTAKFNHSGAPIWSRRDGGANDDMGSAITVDAFGNCYVGGSFNVSGTVGGSATIGTDLLTTFGDEDCFVLKCNSVGSSLWTKQLGGNQYDHLYGITITSGDVICAAGMFQSSVFSSGTHSVNGTSTYNSFCSAYDQNGSNLWCSSFSGRAEILAITSGPMGEVYATGEFSSACTFGSQWVPNIGTCDVFVARIEASGICTAVMTGGGSVCQYGYGVCTDALGTVYVAGKFNSPTFSFGAQPAQNNAGGEDVFVLAVTALVGMPESDAHTSLDVLPNPFTEQIQIRLADGKEEDVFLFDASGREVKRVHMIGSAEIMCDDLAPGMYVIFVGNTSKKMIKQ